MCVALVGNLHEREVDSLVFLDLSRGSLSAPH